MNKPAPKLRPVNYTADTHRGQPVWVLEDPLQLSDKTLILPPLLAQASTHLDGWHTLAEVQANLAAQVGATVPLEVLEELVQSLDALFLFDNERFAGQMAEVRQAWRAQPARPPQLAGRNYPAEPEALAQFLDSYGAGYPKGDDAPWHGRAIISPHIDYQRGGAVYAQVWQQAEKAVQAADLILIFATDHSEGLGSLDPFQRALCHSVRCVAHR